MAVRVTLILLAVTYFLVFIGSACVSLSIGITQIKWNGRCLLFASGKWYHEGHWIFRWVSQTSTHTPCSFVSITSALSAVNAMLMFIYCMYTLLSKSRQGQDIVTLIPAVLSVLKTILLLACAIVISAGLAVFCEAITSNRNIAPTCRDAQTNINWHTVDGSNFYDITNFAQLAGWALFGCSLILNGILFFRLRQDLKSPRPSDLATLTESDERHGL
ncbi:transmembrane protein 179 [Lingula anatina]|uniref:Transmembrane protein 179 n=1 Tax=Lingula anatina TaxID=7574 RepID=A0A1S3HSH2_LINAN|nr:transmembrane protein 179 [Lingula anatina]|eukprot:XP_013388496.1 transmembrane protein 179 [Lingula anatina]